MNLRLSRGTPLKLRRLLGLHSARPLVPTATVARLRQPFLFPLATYQIRRRGYQLALEAQAKFARIREQPIRNVPRLLPVFPCSVFPDSTAISDSGNATRRPIDCSHVRLQEL